METEYIIALGLAAAVLAIASYFIHRHKTDEEDDEITYETADMTAYPVVDQTLSQSENAVQALVDERFELLDKIARAKANKKKFSDMQARADEIENILDDLIWRE